MCETHLFPNNIPEISFESSHIPKFVSAIYSHNILCRLEITVLLGFVT